jgi:Helix-turn-helix domain
VAQQVTIARPGASPLVSGPETGPVGAVNHGGMTVGAPQLGGRRAIRQGRCDVSIGDALAEARRQAGLTVAEVSHRTGIRETIITAIEGDDYSACGGDSYARGTSAPSLGLSALIRSH